MPESTTVRTVFLQFMLISGILGAAPAVLRAQIAARPSAVEVVSPKAPTPVLADGRRVLAYEIHVTNFGKGPLSFEKLEIFGPKPGTTALAAFTDTALTRTLRPIGGDAAGDVRRLDIGRRVIVFLWITLPANEPVPASLRHRLTFALLDSTASGPGAARESVLEGVVVPVLRDPVLVLVPPVRGGTWLAGDGPSNTSNHRRSLTALAGRTWISQRFATDWLMIGANGNSYHDDPSRNENWWGYGQAVRAVADGEVTEVVDGIPENIPRKPPTNVTLENIAGNHVVLRIAPERYVLFAHLQPGSLRVHLHQHVRQGEVLGLLGNSGSSTSPHLHLDVSDGNSPLGSEGVPFLFEAFDFLGFGRDYEQDHHPRIPRRRDMPLEDMVIGFP
jgi:murein DD-endopeptidase MepM/ murein hydrolase activator NlpD